MAEKKSKNNYRFDDAPDLLTLQEASMLVNYNAEYLRQRAVAGSLPAFQLFEEGKRGEWRIYKDDLKEWLDIKRKKAKERVYKTA